MPVHTPAQRKRVLKKIRSTLGTGRNEHPYVTCESCGWTGFDVEHPLSEWVTPCPSCGGEYARYGLDY